MAGIDAIVASSFARIFFRNAINVGLAAIICDTEGIDEGSLLEIRVDEGVLLNKTNGDERKFSPLSSIMRNILNEGGLDHYIARHGGFKI
jgi:3-isopropylmalate/(R)-2-methylmalate dehydratase small subunit